MDGRSHLETEAETVREVMRELEAGIPAFRNKLLDEKGEVRKFLAVFVNGEDIAKGSGAATELKDGDELALVPAAGGG